MTFKEVIYALFVGKQIECKLKSQPDGWYLLRTDSGHELRISNNTISEKRNNINRSNEQ